MVWGSLGWKGHPFKMREFFPSSPSHLTLTQLTGALINNYGQSWQNVQELPVCTSGLQGRFLFSTASDKPFHLRAQEEDHFYIDGVLSLSREIAIATPTVGDSFSFYSFKSGENSYDWYINTEKGTLQEEVYRYVFDATPSGAETLTLNLSLPAGKQITIDWGDGNTTTVTGEVTSTNFSNAYSAGGTYPITIYGDFDALARLLIKDVAVDGDLRDIGTLTGLETFICYGSNTITGNIQYLPVGLTVFGCGGSNTVTGDIQYLPAGLETFSCYGSNTIYGDIGSLPAGLIEFSCYGFNTIGAYTSRTWITKPSTFKFVPVSPGGLSSAEVDQLLIDFDNDLTWSSGDVIRLTGANAPRTSASDVAVANMTAEGASIFTN